MEERYLVAVYGTLRKNQHNSFYLSGTNTKYLGDFQTEPRFTMCSLGGCPSISPSGNTSIYMEVYEVNASTLKNIDGLEGFRGINDSTNFYDRISIKTPWGKAFTYIIPENPTNELVNEGNWVEYINKKKLQNVI